MATINAWAENHLGLNLQETDNGTFCGRGQRGAGSDHAAGKTAFGGSGCDHLCRITGESAVAGR